MYHIHRNTRRKFWSLISPPALIGKNFFHQIRLQYKGSWAWWNFHPVKIFTYRSVLGKRPWAVNHKPWFWLVSWTRPLPPQCWMYCITWDITSIRLYRSCYIDPLKCGTWALTREWASARDTMVYMYGKLILAKLILQGGNVQPWTFLS